ncbi:MAG: hypothetical protein HG450_001295 [Clostridiales bacterium]|jgi:hypothetical protein|nr:hypothetical protein [Clostridiales bacterium]
MKQIEITVRLNENMQSAIRKLEMQGFKKIREGEIDDLYMTSKLNELKKDNIQNILKKSVLLRNLKFENKEIKKITYKNKEIDENGNVISEEKTNLDCNDLEKAKDLFEHLEFEELIKVRYKIIVYSKDEVEYAFQDVENLGTLIEYENTEDFTGKSLDEINDTKNNMYNEIKNTGVNLTDEMDVKKAYELILNKYFKNDDK